MIYIGCDHGGFALKQEIFKYIKEDLALEIEDLGCHDTSSVDYPDYAEKVCKKVVSENAQGILICGTGIGISIAANKINGIRCALCSEPFSAEMTRKHNNANVLAMGGRTTGPELAKSIVKAFLSTDFEGGRHQNRLDKIAALENSK
ncbi:MAG: ribose 5-phosphate isomerase B [Spirochaetales bacterium]|jgi:ribose 5-phosphate isomerase B|nr:ribose 5-phosphate isomerase B [Spirochaetales bacterium]